MFDELPRNFDPIISDDDDDNVDMDQPFNIDYNDPSVIFKKLNSDNSTGLNFGHLNVCSLLKNLDEIKQLLQMNNIHILCLCETRLDNSISDEEVFIDSYKCIRLDRNRHGGGIIIFFHESIVFKYRTDLFVDNLELASIEVCLPKQKPFLLIYWYRPPDSHNDIFD